MSDIFLTDFIYRLRAGSPMPIGVGDFVTHTFMAEKTKVETYLYTNSLPGSSDFRGQQGDYISANFTRLLDSQNESFQGSIRYNPEYISEGNI